jgi:hypothetical protein
MRWLNTAVWLILDPPELLQLPSGKRSLKTKTIRHNLNPVWKEAVRLRLRVSEVRELESTHILFAVWDKVRTITSLTCCQSDTLLRVGL